MPCKVKQRRPNNCWLRKRRAQHRVNYKLQSLSSGKTQVPKVNNLVTTNKAKTLLPLQSQGLRTTRALAALNKNIQSPMEGKEESRSLTGRNMIKARPWLKRKGIGFQSYSPQGKIPRTPEGPDSADDDKLDSEEMFDWNVYLQKTDSPAAPQSAFAHVQPLENCCFEPGMKLECPNRDNTQTFWLATVVTKAPPLVLLRYEGYEDDSQDDFWVNVVTDDIHPVGWCSRTKHSLRPPKAIQHRQKDWYQYLIKHLTGARKAADSLFNTVSGPLSDLKAGLLLEVIDLQDPKRYWFASITEVYAGRLRLQYKGIADSDGELWMYYLDERLQAVGEGAKKHMTVAPPGALLLKISGEVWPSPKVIDKWQNHESSKCLKAILKERKPPRTHAFQVGMKLEAKHPRDPGKICVATVARVYDEHHFLVRIDNLLCTAYREGENSIVCHRDSHGIYPIGWCQKNNVTLHPPKGYNGHFTWNSYLKYCKAVAAPDSCFDLSLLATPNHGFKLTMKLEAVDQEEPYRICVATITFIVGRTMWVTLDGESRSEQIFDALSYDLFPAGWCSATGHELQWPRPDTIEQKNRISRLRVTSDRITRLETLRKGRFKRQNSFSGGSNENSDHESPTPKKTRKVNNARYVRGRKQIKSKEPTEPHYLDRRYIDPTMPYVCIHEIGLEFNTEEQIRKNFRLDADGNLPKVVVTLDSDDEEKGDGIKQGKEESLQNADLRFMSYLGIKPKSLTKQEESEFYSKPKPAEEDEDEVVATVVKMPARSGKGSLDSIVAKLRNNSCARPKLLDTFRRERGVPLPNGRIHLCAKHMHQYAKKIDATQQSRPHSLYHSHARDMVSNGTVVHIKPFTETNKQQLSTLTPGDRVKHTYPAYVGKNLTANGVEQPVVMNRPISKGAATMTGNVVGQRREKAVQASRPQPTRVLRSKEGLSNGCPHGSSEVRGKDGQQYRVIQNVVSGEGHTNKIVIKLARPSVASSTRIDTGVTAKSWEQPTDCPLIISDVRSVASSKSVTPVSSGSSARSSENGSEPLTTTGDEHEEDTTNYNDPLEAENLKEVQELCQDLPTNPSTWNMHDVARFIKLADCQPFARLFTEQEVDGSAFLLLTLHEIHKLLGVTLGPAIRLANHIQMLRKISKEQRQAAPVSR